MPTNIIKDLQARLRGLMGVHNDPDETAPNFDVKDQVERLWEQSATYKDFTPATTAADTDAQLMLCHFPNQAKVLAIGYLPDGTLTSSNTDNATLQVLYGAGAAAPASDLGSVTTNTTAGDMAVGVPYALTLDPDAVELAAGSSISFGIPTKTGNGVAVPAGRAFVVYREL